MNTKRSRRDFLKTTLGATALIGFPTIIPASALGKNGTVAPSNRVTVAVIGCGDRSKSCWAYKNYDKAEILAVCDPFAKRRIERAKEWGVQDHYEDFRDVLARDDIDAVHIVTQDHWHVPISLAAARAGKDVYCEKPLGLTIEEDLTAREIVDKYGRVFQYGTQQRSTQVCRMPIELVLNGHIGEVKEIVVWAPGGATGGNATPAPIPEGLNYDLWLGPAPDAPYTHDRVEGKGCWFCYDYAIGFIAGWGAHPLDQLQWWADAENRGIPVEYRGKGNIPTGGLFDTINSWDVESAYADGLKMRFMDTGTVRGPNSPVDLDKFGAADAGNCTLFMGTEGWVWVSRGVFKTSSDALRRKAKDPGDIRLPVSKQHMANFVDCVLTREQPVSSLESGIKSDIISQMGDICIRTGETVSWDPVKETVVGSDQAVSMMHRPMRAPWTL
ncbi:MAG: Gfo/Idh/MocA family oxidoreductase [Verrucomicrobiota bacterium]